MRLAVPNIVVTWSAGTEKLVATVSHAMLVVPEGADHHRVYFAAHTKKQLAQMTAVMLEMAVRNGGGDVIELALKIIDRNPAGEFRGIPRRDWPSRAEGGEAR
jgi:hypothetical protein